jgi:hypothetical protein
VHVLDLERYQPLVALVYDDVRANRTARRALRHLDLGAYIPARAKRELDTLTAALEARRDDPVYILLNQPLRQKVDVGAPAARAGVRFMRLGRRHVALGHVREISPHRRPARRVLVDELHDVPLLAPQAPG